MSKACVACPFRDGETLEATQGQNWGCLPSSHDMVKLFDDTGRALSCHNNDSLPCRGLSEVRDTSQSPVKPYSDWYEGK